MRAAAPWALAPGAPRTCAGVGTMCAGMWVVAPGRATRTPEDADPRARAPRRDRRRGAAFSTRVSEPFGVSFNVISFDFRRPRGRAVAPDAPLLASSYAHGPLMALHMIPITERRRCIRIEARWRR